jgi:hypothetical protein
MNGTGKEMHIERKPLGGMGWRRKRPVEAR